LHRRLDSFLESARAAWPTLAIDADDFMSFVAERVADGAWPEALESLEAPGLYLACACAAGDEAAIALFDARFATEIRVALASMNLDVALASDITQSLRTKLFVADSESRPKIATYKGRGALRSWVRAIAVRTAISHLRGRKREVPVPDPILGAIADSSDDPRMAHLKDTYHGEFRTAFRSAFDALGARERTLLRYKFADGMNIDEIASIYGLHRATAARRLAKIRETLLSATRTNLKRALDVGSDEFDSIVRLIQSRLDVTLSGMWSVDREPKDV